MSDFPPAWRGWFGRRGNDGLTNLERTWYAEKYERVMRGYKPTPECRAAAMERLKDQPPIPRCDKILDDGTECRKHIYLRDAIGCLEHRVRLAEERGTMTDEALPKIIVNLGLDGPKDTTEFS